MRRVNIQILSVALALGIFVSCGNNANNEPKDTQEIAEDKNDAKFNTNDAERNAEFLVDAANENYEDIEAAKVAAQRATNPKVKELANEIITEHQANLEQIKQIAAAKSISVPTSPTQDALDASKKWNDKKVENFDKDFVSDLAKRHKDHIDDLESKLNKINDVDIQNYIQNTIAKLRTHYDKIVSVETSLK